MKPPSPWPKRCSAPSTAARSAPPRQIRRARRSAVASSRDGPAGSIASLEVFAPMRLRSTPLFALALTLAPTVARAQVYALECLHQSPATLREYSAIARPCQLGVMNDAATSVTSTVAGHRRRRAVATDGIAVDGAGRVVAFEFPDDGHVGLAAGRSSTPPRAPRRASEHPSTSSSTARASTSTTASGPSASPRAPRSSRASSRRSTPPPARPSPAATCSATSRAPPTRTSPRWTSPRSRRAASPSSTATRRRRTTIASRRSTSRPRARRFLRGSPSPRPSAGTASE